MKKFYILTTMVLGSLNMTKAQVVFASSLETWSTGLPTDMFGSRSNISSDSVFQVTGSSTYGNNAVRLQNNNATHKRFTTQAVSVTSGTTYTIKYWVKGQGNIRTGLYDGRSGTGYSAYSSYNTVNSSSYTMYTSTVSCTHDTTGGEFIFSVQSTTGPNHLMIDSINISIGSAGPSNVSIYDIQYTTSGPSSYDGQLVNTGGIVVAYYSNGYFLQSGSGAWRGIEVYDTVNNPAVGDSLTFMAEVDEFFSNTRLINITSYTVVSAGNPEPAPVTITTTQGNTEDYEGTLVVTTGKCTDANAGFGMWVLYTSPDSLKIDDMMYSFTPILNTDYEVKGCISYNFGEFKLNPRKPSDVTALLSVNENTLQGNLEVYPNPANNFVTVKTTAKVESVNLFDLTGKNVASANSKTLSTEGLAPGVYLLKVVSDRGAGTLKVVVKH